MIIRFGAIHSLVAAVLLVQSIAIANDAADQAPQAAASDDAIKQMKQERVKLLSQVVKADSIRYREGQLTLEEVNRNRQVLLAARLELADTDAQHIEIINEMVENQEQTYKLVERQVSDGTAPAIDLLEARAEVLRYKIALESKTQAIGEAIKQMRTERLELFEKILAGVERDYNNGGVTTMAILQEKRLALLQARLELAETKDQRIEVLKQMVKFQEDNYSFITQEIEFGEMPKIDLLEARVAVLDSRIALAREEAK